MVRTDVLDEVGSDKFFDHMDELLNFQNDDLEDGLFGSGAVDVDSFPPVWFDEPAQLSSTGRSKGLSDVSSADRTPRYDIVRLEWLSNFVQDSLSKVKTLPLCHAKRARSKRPRPATFYPPPSYFLYPKKKQKKKLPTIGGSNGQSDNKEEDPLEDPPRKCTHCEITKTPLWRTGPSGPKTLCNACGVRYKKGLLFPEYRPAASPTFVPLLHSNSYKKVFEMRKSKNLGETVQPEHCLNSNKTDKDHEITNSTLCGEALEARKGTFTTLEDPVTTSDLGETVQPEHCLNSNKTDKGLEITNSALCGETFEAGKVRSTTLEDSVTTIDLVSLQV